MPLTNGEELMVDLMARIGLTEDETIGVMLTLKTKEERAEFLLWMYRNADTASPQDALIKVFEIKGYNSVAET